MNRVVVVGASLAGLAFVQAMRREGYDGELVVVGEEPHRPYDRPPLSKELLLGRVEPADLFLEAPDDDLGVDWRLGSRAVGLDVQTRRVVLEDGSAVAGDAVVVATGARARTLEEVVRDPTRAPAGVHTLRGIEDALRLREDLVRGGPLVVLGGGFIGAEVAAAARQLGVDVDVVEAGPTLLAMALGVEAGGALTAVHESHGVRVHTGVAVVGVGGEGRVREVFLADGRALPADAVLVALGATPNLDWLAESGLPTSRGLLCDEHGIVAPGVLAVGDCAAWFDPDIGTHRRVEHWTDARVRAGAVARMLSHPTEPVPPLPAPYVWSDQYDLRIQYAGRHANDDHFVVEAGTFAGGDLIATYRRGESTVAVLGVNQPREFGRRRRALGSHLPRQIPQPVSMSSGAAR